MIRNQTGCDGFSFFLIYMWSFIAKTTIKSIEYKLNADILFKLLDILTYSEKENTNNSPYL